MSLLSGVAFLVISFFTPSHFSKLVSVSNTDNLKDTDGNFLITGELDILYYDSTYYLVMTNWGGCADYGGDSPCVYANNHTIVMYSTVDFVDFVNHGVLLNVSQMEPGYVFRPHLVYNEKTKTFVLWYHDRKDKSDRNYAIAVSKNPTGPYQTVVKHVELKYCSPGGDYDIFVDDKDGSAYIILTHYSYLCIEKLDESYMKGIGNGQKIHPPQNCEAPVMFKRNENDYYTLFGACCCACTIGANIYVYHSTSPLGSYTLLGDIGSNEDKTYTTKSQQATVFPLPNSPNPNSNFVWVGNNWGSDEKTHMFNRDLLYFYPLEWEEGEEEIHIKHVLWNDTVKFYV